MDFYAGTLFTLLMLAFVNTGDSQAYDKKYLFVSYGHAAQVNCNLRENDLNVTLYVKRYNPTARKVVVDNVKWTEQNGLFTMQGVRPLDGGNYFCKVVNISGHERITTNVYVIPIVAPSTNKFKLDVTPHSVSLHYEDYANISCSSFGKRELKWYKIGPREKLMDVDNEDIIDDDHYDTDGGTRLYHSRLILSLKDVTNQNAGRYKCIARSNGQELAKNVVVIVRNPKKPVIRHFPPVVIASEGISVTIKCKIKGSPRPKMTWYKDDRLLAICEGGRSQKCQSFTKLKLSSRKIQ
ncbi:leucine-rich repeats and immunoglobulin-like domains protein 1 [Xenia sp. Carnegie-2017]|uniref:leucine-rich repeats and immunoglobulin-like domains protein 1 n=1 Tax=Xenia sp. Carnegie-2017 TaxID=2897299 RepID=UPI001F03F24F|nr:leucine-rich repeats and immunoglobulin-like domains protein 1 [Xenia sp. Carnegie-2017]